MTNQFEVKNVKSFIGNEGYGYNASLYINGVRSAIVVDAAQGWEVEFKWLKGSELAEKVWNDHCKEVETRYNGSWGIVIGAIIDDYENKKWLKKHCKNKTVFRLKGDKDNEYRTMNRKYSPVEKQYLEGKYGDDLVQIMNEEV